MLKLDTRYIGKEDKELIKKVLTHAAEKLSQKEDLEVEISFVGRDAIREINAEERNVDRVTDVLSFPALDGIKGKVLDKKDYSADVNPETGCILLGEIVICRDMVRKQALEYGHSYERELAFLSLHGFLHLMGYDHIEESDRTEMESLAESILRDLEISRDSDDSSDSSACKSDKSSLCESKSDESPEDSSEFPEFSDDDSFDDEDSDSDDFDDEEESEAIESPESPARRNLKSGYIAIVGKANAGKSSLLNSIIEQKISIVSPKPQTTRNKILGIFTEGDVQMIFVDTPGSLRVSNKLGDFMARSIVSAVRDVNCILVVIDGHNGIKDDDIELLRKHISGGIPTVAVISKTDISQPEKLMPELAKLNSVEGLESVWAVSAKRNRNVRELREYLKRFMTDDVFYFDEDDVTDRSQRFIVCEIIREKILLALDEEVPHGTGVQLNKMEYDPRRRLWDVDANIIVEKASHKPIIIGKRGQTLKEIGTHARQGIEKLLGCRVYLSLWIKVKEDWRNSDYLLKDIGYDKKEELEE